MSWAPVAKEPRHKTAKYKRQHKARHLQELARERRAADKAAALLARRSGWSWNRFEAAFKGCDPTRLEDL